MKAPVRKAVQVINQATTEFHDDVAARLRLRSRLKEVATEFTQALAKTKEWVEANRETAEDTLTCMAIMATGTFVLYMAAVLQGGAV